jgi:type IX secretion system PorP/SprF family membrane protein
VGASCLQIQQNKLKFFDYMSGTTSVMNRHFYGMLGYRQHVGEDFVLEPSALLKYVYPAPFQFDIGMRAIYKEKVWLGASYRNLDAFAFYAGFVIRENLQLGYSYDFTTTNLGNYSTGTHELTIGIRFNKTGVIKPKDSESKFD